MFDCGCEIRWIQLWYQRGVAGLDTQQLYCRTGASKIPLENMYIHSCGKRTEGRAGKMRGLQDERQEAVG